MRQPTRPIRVTNVIARLNIGGPAVIVALLAARIGPPDFESDLVCGQIGPEEGDMLYYAEDLGVHPLILPELGRELHPFRDLVTLGKLVRLLRRLKPDVVHTHTAKAGFVGRIAARLAGVPVVVHTFHGHVFHGYFSPGKTRLFLLLERFTARLSNAVITLSDSLRDELCDVYHIAPREKFRVFGVGLDLASFAETPRRGGTFRAAWNIPADVPLIGIVGRLVPVKNHALFLAMAAQVRARLPEARFVIVGDGELRKGVEQLVDALGLREAVTFTGWLRDLPPIYSDLDALVISSLNEGTPVSVIEALAAGCPVAATAVGGLPDLLDRGAFGVLTPSQDAAALAEAVVRLIEAPPDPANAQTAMLLRYSIDRLARDLEELYRTQLAGRGRRMS